MTADSIFQFRKAVYQKLTGDSAFMALVKGVYDYVPENTEFPYIKMDHTKYFDWSTKTTKGAKIDIRIETYSRERGAKNCLDIMTKIHDLLNKASLTLVNHNLILIMAESSEVEQLSDGLIYRGISRFSALLEEA